MVKQSVGRTGRRYCSIIGRLIIIIGASLLPKVQPANLFAANLAKINYESHLQRCGGSWDKPNSGILWSLNDQFVNMYQSGQGNENMKYKHCFCGYNNDYDQYIDFQLTNQVSGVKTIITTHTLDQSSSFNIKYSTDGTNYYTACSDCYMGSNDFTEAPLTFKYLRLEWNKGRTLSICQIWIYQYTNYVVNKGAQITSEFEQAHKDSVNANTYATNPVIAGLGERYHRDFDGSHDHTCIRVQYRNDKQQTRLSTILVVLPYYMVIKEFHVSNGQYETELHLIDPLDQDINSKTVTQIVNTQVTRIDYDIDAYPTNAVVYVGKVKYVATMECTAFECTDFATNKILLTVQNIGQDFFLCGFAIMAEKVPCPPTSTQCGHSFLKAPTTIIADMTVGLGMSVTSGSWYFDDGLSTQCINEGSTGCTKTFELHCTGLSSTSTFYSLVDFYQINGAGNEWTLTITSPSTTVRSIASRTCKIIAKLEDQKQESNTFSVKEACLPCSTTEVIKGTVPFLGTIPVGETGSVATWIGFTDTVSDCGSVCPLIDHSCKCRQKSEGGAYEEENPDWTYNLGYSSGINQYQILARSTSIQLHGIVWQCVIEGTHSQSGSTALSDVFEVIFDVCQTPEESCPENIWQQPPDSWVEPAAMIVFLDDVTMSSSFHYSHWKDYFSLQCGFSPCGEIIYEFQVLDESTKKVVSVADLPYVTTQDAILQTVTISLATTDIAYSREYIVRIIGSLANNNIWNGTVEWDGDFDLTVVDPCVKENPCQYSSLVVPALSPSDMTAYVNNIVVPQTFTQWNDTISTMCPKTQCLLVYTLVYDDNQVKVSDKLAKISNDQIQVRTKSYVYAGVSTVKLKCELKSGAVIILGYSKPFDINIDCCNTLSCLYTALIALDSSDSRPSSYNIGVEGTAGTTSISQFTNTCGALCSTDANICGYPVYTLMQSDGTAYPSFMSMTSTSTSVLGVVSPVDPIVQSSSTISVDDADPGTYVMKIEAFLDLTNFVQSHYTPPNSILYTNMFTVTVNQCSPLPCKQNWIQLPSATDQMAQQMYVKTDNEVVNTTFLLYQDEVSIRCQTANAYVDLCGAKSYAIEYDTGGGVYSEFHTDINLSVACGAEECTIESHVSNEEMVDYYNSRIHASFVDATDNADSDDSSYKFPIMVEYLNPCFRMNCSRNFIYELLDNFTLPSNFSVNVDLKWGQTVYDGFNDTKTQVCYGEPGQDEDGTDVDAFPWPVCGEWPIYELLYADTKKPVSDAFGRSNILIEYYQATEYTRQWVVKARTNDRDLDGEHRVLLSVKVNEDSKPVYSNEFWIEVEDPCQPINCSETVYYPEDTQSPSDINIRIGEGFVSSSQSVWSNTLHDECGSPTVEVCGPINYLLYDALTNELVEFNWRIKSKSDELLVEVIITDEAMIGLTYEVYLVGYGLNNTDLTVWGTNGTSTTFEVIVSEEEADQSFLVSSNAVPFFSTFPSDIDFTIKVDEPITYEVDAVAEDTDGYVVSMEVDLGSALSFVKATISTDSVAFTISLSSSLSAGKYKIKVTATDESGGSTINDFSIVIAEQIVVTEATNSPTFTAHQQSAENITEVEIATVEPLTAKIKSISVTGQMTIAYSRRVVPVANVSLIITPDEFHVTLEQLSDEEDQTVDFTYKLLEHTPYNIYVQLYFVRPLEISQGKVADIVQVQMRKNLFMVEDTEGTFENWQPGNTTNDTGINVQVVRETKSPDSKVLQTLNRNVPKQVESEEAKFALDANVLNFKYLLQIMFVAPLSLHLIGFGSMDLAWVLFGNLQVINIITQFDLKLPQNVIAVTESYADIANQQFVNEDEVYLWLRTLASDKPYVYVEPEPEPEFVWNQPDCEEVECDDDRRLQDTQILSKTNTTTTETATATVSSEVQQTEYELSRFYNKGSSDKVMATFSLMLVSGIVLFLIAFFGFSLEKSILYLFPKKLQETFHWLRNRIYWCLPLRIMMQQYVSVTLSIFLNLKYQDAQDTDEHKVNRAFSFVLLTFYSIGFPLFIIVFVLRNRKTIYLNEMQRKYDSIYMAVDFFKKRGIVIHALSLTRKFLFIFIAVMFNFSIIQFTLALYLQQIFTFYLLMVKPMRDIQRDRVEIINEITIFALILLMCTLTDYVPSPAIRYNIIGWVMIYIVWGQVCVNGCFLTVSIFQQLKRIYKIIRFRHVMRLRKVQTDTHNQTVDLVGVKNEPNNFQYKREQVKATSLLQNQLDVIEEESSEISSISLNRSSSQQGSTKIKKIDARKREFNQMMDEMRKQDKVQAHQTESEPMTTGTNLNDVRGILQTNNDWPVTPREANLKKSELPEINQMLQTKNEWAAIDIDKSVAEDWDALPANYSNHLDRSIAISDESNQKKQRLEGKHDRRKTHKWDNNNSVDAEVDANQNSKEASRWKQDDSVFFSDQIAQRSIKQMRNSAKSKFMQDDSISFSDLSAYQQIKHKIVQTVKPHKLVMGGTNKDKAKQQDEDDSIFFSAPVSGNQSKRSNKKAVQQKPQSSQVQRRPDIVNKAKQDMSDEINWTFD